MNITENSEKGIKLLIRLISICFMAFGAWLLIRALFLVYPKSGILDFAEIVLAIVLFRVGDNLFSLKEFGRKFAVLTIGINMAAIIIQTIYILSGASFSYTASWLENITSPMPLFMYNFVVLLLYGLIVLFLMKEKTKGLFQK